MQKINNGGPAFPRAAGDYTGTRHGNHAQTGLSLRDYFAAKAMQGIAASVGAAQMRVDEAADFAYLIADAMLDAREQTEE
jgi:hypothetical protein